MISKIQDKKHLGGELIMLKALGKELYKYGFFIAGGSVWCAFRGLPINDIDIMHLKEPTTHYTLGDYMGILRKAFEVAGFTCSVSQGILSKFANNISCHIDGKDYKVQFIQPSGKAVGSPLEVLNKFDIKNAACYIDDKGNVRHLASIGTRNVDTISDLHMIASNLHIGLVTNVAHTLQRINKYIGRGLIAGPEIYYYMYLIQKAQFLRQLVDEDYQEYLEDPEGYEEFTLESEGFTVEGARRYLEQNVKDYKPSLSVPQREVTTSTTFPW